ncbi:SAM-dependent methyltransferase [Kibdelosporangium philippinense]|uniref:SAM-dependent methyltransferase n=1 Tax=Kibdelosporangium philippinense TaxID=211113 RepID=A0ABS8ZFS8_9PSEU|nr:SAM-dependent methyltransferase [Kibdelosporangium philippinense]MCE7006681.1 SAM-dependent methyltransferase [Kibdelosporangium philippinense]
MTRATPPPLPPIGPRSYDSEMPNASRMYDYYLGGAMNFTADRELAERAKTVLPCTPSLARLNRSWLRRVVNVCLDEGIDQFLDLGSGIPTVGNVHEIVQRRAPQGRVMYVDYDATAVTHARKLLKGNENAGILHADIRDPDTVLEAPEVRALLDFSRPIGLLMVGILLYVGEEYSPAGLVAAYRDACAPGSLLPISVITTQIVAERDPVTHKQILDLIAVYADASEQIRDWSKADLAAWFTGMDLLEPGITILPEWRPDGSLEADNDSEARLLGIGGMGRVLS